MRRPVQGRQRAGQRRCHRGRAALPCVKVLYPFIHSFTCSIHSRILTFGSTSVKWDAFTCTAACFELVIAPPRSPTGTFSVAPSSGAAAAHAILGALSFVFRSAAPFQREDSTVDGVRLQSDPPLARRSDKQDDCVRQFCR